MANILTPYEFLLKSKELPVIDVRSPGEYAHAHIPGALSLPLFDDTERAEVGTLYKKSGRVKAIQKGLDIVGPKLSFFTRYALSLNSPEILVHCWRGGMRSSAMAWLLENVGLKCYLLEGGYKHYRNYVLDSFVTPLNIVLLGGFTGSGKTDIIKALKAKGEQVLDLEGLANHKGSAFGALGEQPQPGAEHFENLIHASLSGIDYSKRIWIEDESRNIGRAVIPAALWSQMRNSSLIRIETPFDIRLERLMRDYGAFPPDQLISSIQKIEKRLGYDRCKFAIEACQQGDIKRAAEIALIYYDRAYGDQLTKRFTDRPDSILTFDQSDKEITDKHIEALIQRADHFNKG